MSAERKRDASASAVAPRYHRVRELARGGMAVLELARSEGAHGFEKYVVIKRISPKWADDPEFIEMFLAEARLAATLDHPHAVRVHDLGQDEDGLFFVMDYIHGHDLSALMRTHRRPLEVRHALTIGIAAAAGLHHAHTRRDFAGQPLGIIHRDVSPTNILVTADGGVKLVDFGIAKATHARGGTRPSIRKGKIGYMSPEQCKGAPLDPRSDLFGLGIVLHQLLSGRRLFVAENEFAVMNAIVNHDAPRLTELRDDMPEAVSDVIARALSRRPSERYPDARAMQRALEGVAETLGLTPSASALGDFVSTVFGEQPYPWESEREGPTTTPRSDPSVTAATRVVPRAATASTSDPPSSGRGPMIGLGLLAASALGLGGWLVLRPSPASAPAATERVEAAAAAPDDRPPPTNSPASSIDAGDPPSTPADPIEAPPAKSPAPADAPPHGVAEPQLAPETEPTASDPPSAPRAAPRRKRRRPSAPTPQTPPPADEPSFDPDGLGPVRTVLQ